MSDLMNKAKEQFPNTDWEYTFENMVVSKLKVMKSGAGYYVGRSCAELDEDSNMLWLQLSIGIVLKTITLNRLALCLKEVI